MSPSRGARAFLTAEWRYLLMLNWRVDPALLRARVPRGTELDTWQGHCYVSLVGFCFLGTRVLGVGVPLHRDFEEVNLRFYVRREVGGEVRRGVTFVRELVPRAAIAAIARLAYNEPYRALAMSNRIVHPVAINPPTRVEFRWRRWGRWSGLSAAGGGPASVPRAGTEAEFITEHYWGYTRQRFGGTIEYRVSHPRWRVWPARDAALEGEVGGLYGRELGAALAAPPDSAFIADGSPVTVYRPTTIA